LRGGTKKFKETWEFFFVYRSVLDSTNVILVIIGGEKKIINSTNVIMAISRHKRRKLEIYPTTFAILFLKISNYGDFFFF
jgi:hypothetical protein